MKHRIPASPGQIRGIRALHVALALLWLALAPLPTAASTHAPPDVGAFAVPFQEICQNLIQARDELGRGLLSEERFADRILELFARAESLEVAMRQLPLSGRRTGVGFALERGFRYLRDSLRENYAGIVARNGVSFVKADWALEAAVAWKLNAVAVAARGGP